MKLFSGVRTSPRATLYLLSMSLLSFQSGYRSRSHYLGGSLGRSVLSGLASLSDPVTAGLADNEGLISSVKGAKGHVSGGEVGVTSAEGGEITPGEIHS